MINTNTLRQIVDIQVQAERIINQHADISSIEQFAQYNQEMKSFLLGNISESFILDHVREIPDLNIEELKQKSNTSSGLLGLLLGIWGAYNRDRQVMDNAIEIIRHIKGKYASIEFMMKNSL